MKKLITIVAAMAVSVSFATAADAPKKEAKGEKKAGGEERFKKLDSNSDGFISLDELKASPLGQKDAAKAEEMFKHKDTDGDGKLSPAEFAAGGGKKGDAPKKGDATVKTEGGDAKAGEKPGAGGDKPAGVK